MTETRAQRYSRALDDSARDHPSEVAALVRVLEAGREGLPAGFGFAVAFRNAAGFGHGFIGAPGGLFRAAHSLKSFLHREATGMPAGAAEQCPAVFGPVSDGDWSAPIWLATKLIAAAAALPPGLGVSLICAHESGERFGYIYRGAAGYTHRPVDHLRSVMRWQHEAAADGERLEGRPFWCVERIEPFAGLVKALQRQSSILRSRAVQAHLRASDAPLASTVRP